MNAYPITNAWRKRHYVARITGPHDKYVVDREFIQGRPIKSRGIIAYETADIGTTPAWLIRADDTGRREVIAAYGATWETFGGLDSAGLLEVWQHGPPGDPDAWQGERCEGCHEAPTFPDGPTRCDECNQGAQALAYSSAHADPF